MSAVNKAVSDNLVIFMPKKRIIIYGYVKRMNFIVKNPRIKSTTYVKYSIKVYRLTIYMHIQILSSQIHPLTKQYILYHANWILRKFK
jgi:hypothetical protein